MTDTPAALDVLIKERVSEQMAQKEHEILAIRQAHEQRVAELEAELAEQQASFDLRWKADMRAIKKWQAETGRTLEWPDHADLCVWLLGKLDSQADEIERLRAERDEARDMLKVEASAFRALYTEACSEKAAAESRCAALTEALGKVADDLEAELRARYAGTLDYPAMKARFNRDMEVVVEARALATEGKENG